jgi:hypothetical protein
MPVAILGARIDPKALDGPLPFRYSSFTTHFWEMRMATDVQPAQSRAGFTLRLDEVVIDCGEPCALATFWSEALGYELAECDEDVASIEDPSGTGPSMLFQRVPETKSAKNRVHLDLNVGSGDLETAVAQLISLGARRVEVGQASDPWWVVLADPEGNEFCVVA